ncbi:Methyltransferase domain-containing protein [Plantibacter flavus]|uniref:Methyltransferase family protein n=1 Tax=Plantibacter flavus TaxID=150123 RepID=A0A3N2C2F4_9MICO|nr:class I SAM-dependent methyltransferase [Plantibacter flavus]ROR81701.1 methyltransferase family protein [Plantibacter flavus]SMG15803.1 Methyltransferase domain-containing protein [Plantibacter flavus]
MPHQHTTPDHVNPLARLLALDALVHEELIKQAVAVALSHTDIASVARIIDVGVGTGAGAFALVEEYSAAHVLGVDLDADMLAGVRQRADHRELGDRISTALLDVGDPDFDAGVADLIWSSNVLHEVRDPAVALRNLFRSLRPGGVLVVMEMDASPSVLPPSLQPVERALRVAAGADGLRVDWSGPLRAAGVDLLETRTAASDQLLPADGAAGEYAALELQRLLDHASPTLTEQIAAEVRDLVADLSGSHRRLTELHIRGTRTVWVARRL